MKASQILAGFSLAEADMVRKAIGKKDIEKMKKIIRVGAADGCTSGEEAVSRLQDGTFCLTRQMFDQAMQAYVPTPKDDIERRLNEFERQMSYM